MRPPSPTPHPLALRGATLKAWNPAPGIGVHVRPSSAE